MGRPAKITAGRPRGIMKYLKLTLTVISGLYGEAEADDEICKKAMSY